MLFTLEVPDIVREGKAPAATDKIEDDLDYLCASDDDGNGEKAVASESKVRFMRLACPLPITAFLVPRVVHDCNLATLLSSSNQLHNLKAMASSILPPPFVPLLAAKSCALLLTQLPQQQKVALTTTTTTMKPTLLCIACSLPPPPPSLHRPPLTRFSRCRSARLIIR